MDKAAARLCAPSTPMTPDEVRLRLERVTAPPDLRRELRRVEHQYVKESLADRP